MLQQLQRSGSVFDLSSALRMPPHSAPSAAGGDVMDICEATYEVTGDQRGALITTQQVRITSGRPRVSTVSG